jgi:hypothetical protein
VCTALALLAWQGTIDKAEFADALRQVNKSNPWPLLAVWSRPHVPYLCVRACVRASLDSSVSLCAWTGILVASISDSSILWPIHCSIDAGIYSVFGPIHPFTLWACACAIYRTP